MVDWSDIILAFDKDNITNMLIEFPDIKNKLFLLGVLQAGEKTEIEDLCAAGDDAVFEVRWGRAADWGCVFER